MRADWNLPPGSSAIRVTCGECGVRHHPAWGECGCAQCVECGESRALNSDDLCEDCAFLADDAAGLVEAYGHDADCAFHMARGAACACRAEDV